MALYKCRLETRTLSHSNLIKGSNQMWFWTKEHAAACIIVHPCSQVLTETVNNFATRAGTGLKLGPFKSSRRSSKEFYARKASNMMVHQIGYSPTVLYSSYKNTTQHWHLNRAPFLSCVTTPTKV